MKNLKKWAMTTGAVIMLVSVFAFAAPTPKVEAAVVNGSDPIATGCARDAKTVGWSYWGSQALELRYSPNCRSAWAKVNLGKDLNIREGHARVTRNDGVSYSCSVKRSLGQTSCYTRQVNDAGYTARATVSLLYVRDGGGTWINFRTGWY